MEIEIKVIFTDIIKPSSPTPKSLQKHQLSFIDQASLPFFIPIVYFYSSNPKISDSQKSNHLKKSLSETLSIYYPLAGRLVDKLYVDCKDAGVPFAQAEANCDLTQVITNPDPERIKKLLFYKLDETHDHLCMAVQATYFRCGGVALVILFSHKIVDGLSMAVFTKTWSAIARNGCNDGVPIPKFDAAAYFPPRDLPASFDIGAVVTKQEEIATKIFTFSAEKIELLHERYSAAAGNPRRQRPSRVDLVAAYIWTRFLSTTDKQGDPTKIYTLHQPINLRSRVDQSMSEYSFGNIIWVSIATLAAGDDGVELQRKLREAKKAAYDGYAAQMRDMSMADEITANKGKRISFLVTSLCGFPLYEADFGWGEPVWATSPGIALKNAAANIDTKCGGGIDAVVHLSKTDMEKFEQDLDLLLIKSNL